MTAKNILSGRAEALADETTFDDSGFVIDDSGFDGEQLDREERAALRRVSGLSTELEDVTEVEYRQLRLERVVLAAVWSEGTADDAAQRVTVLEIEIAGAGYCGRQIGVTFGKSQDALQFFDRGTRDAPTHAHSRPVVRARREA